MVALNEGSNLCLLDAIQLSMHSHGLIRLVLKGIDAVVDSMVVFDALILQLCLFYHAESTVQSTSTDGTGPGLLTDAAHCEHASDAAHYEYVYALPAYACDGWPTLRRLPPGSFWPSPSQPHPAAAAILLHQAVLSQQPSPSSPQPTFAITPTSPRLPPSQ